MYSAGAGIGNILAPITIEFLSNAMGWRKALLVYGICLLVVLTVAGLSYRPIRMLPIMTDNDCDEEGENFEEGQEATEHEDISRIHPSLSRLETVTEVSEENQVEVRLKFNN